MGVREGRAGNEKGGWLAAPSPHRARRAFCCYYRRPGGPAASAGGGPGGYALWGIRPAWPMQTRAVIVIFPRRPPMVRFVRAGARSATRCSLLAYTDSQGPHDPVLDTT